MAGPHVVPRWVVAPRHAEPGSGIAQSQPCICKDHTKLWDSWEASARLRVVGIADLAGMKVRPFVHQNVSQITSLFDPKSWCKIVVRSTKIFAFNRNGDA
jgi:hypothetical protein